VAGPAYRRLHNDERRALLLERATQLFGEHGYDALSMARIAREAKIAILDWIAHGDMTREELHGMLLGTFAGALAASGADAGRVRA
jgi:Bacterial regulatory proteins, tetR family